MTLCLCLEIHFRCVTSSRYPICVSPTVQVSPMGQHLWKSLARRWWMMILWRISPVPCGPIGAAVICSWSKIWEATPFECMATRQKFWRVKMIRLWQSELHLLIAFAFFAGPRIGMADYWLPGFQCPRWLKCWLPFLDLLEATMPIQATEPSLILPTKRASMSLQAQCWWGKVWPQCSVWQRHAFHSSLLKFKVCGCIAASQQKGPNPQRHYTPSRLKKTPKNETYSTDRALKIVMTQLGRE